MAAVGGLKDGAIAYINKIKTELVQAMVLTRTQQVDDVSDTILLKP